MFIDDNTTISLQTNQNPSHFKIGAWLSIVTLGFASSMS